MQKVFHEGMQKIQKRGVNPFGLNWKLSWTKLDNIVWFGFKNDPI